MASLELVDAGYFSLICFGFFFLHIKGKPNLAMCYVLALNSFDGS